MKKKNQKWIISVLTFVLFFLMSIGLSAEVAPPYSASLLANPPFDNLGNNSTATLVQALLGQFQLRLTVTDSAGNSDSTTYTLRGRLPPPDWIEIPPFSAGKDDAHLIKTDSNETRDEEGLTATASKDFTIRQGTEIEADFMCSLDKQTWRSCDDLYLLFRKQWIYLKDDEGLAKHSIPYEDINRRTWEIKRAVDATWTIFAPAFQSDPISCVVKLQKNGTRIAEINIGEFFDIFVGNSTGSISKVRFLSDENQNNIVDEGFTWTDPYDWNVSKDDWTGSWNATSKIKTWAFVTPGIKEVWAEITDSSGNTSRHNADIIAYPESSQRFLTPPYKDAEIKVQQGWTSSRDPDHQGIDYIKGPIDNAGTIDKPLWQTFNVVAAADGIARQGIEASGSKYVKILHPQKAPSGKNYCTYYGHLDTISDKIKPNICVPVKRGEFIGEAGATGVPYPPGDPPWIHLHFTVLADNFPNCVDPYDIYNTREHYPRGTEDTECIIHTNCGQDRLWITDPPAVFIFRLKCPTDLIVTDPDGVTISKEIGATNGMYYMEYDPNGNGEINDVVGIVDAKVGNYQIRVVPEQDAPTTATYTLEVSGEDRAVILADNVQIGNIPTEPYTVNSIEVLPITRTAVSPSIWTLYQ